MKLVSILMLIYTQTVFAYEYSFELTHGVDKGDLELGETRTAQSAGIWYPHGVAQNSMPVAEAAFLARSTNFRYSNSKTDTHLKFSPIDQNGNPLPASFLRLIADKVESRTQSFGYTHHFSEWFGGLSVARSDARLEYATGGRRTVDRYKENSVIAGRFVSPRTSISAIYTYRSKDTPRVEAPYCLDPCPKFAREEDSTAHSLRINLKHVSLRYSAELDVGAEQTKTEAWTRVVGTVSRGDQWPYPLLFLDVSLVRSYNRTESYHAGVRGTWYPSSGLGIGASATYLERGPFRNEHYSVFVRWFMNQAVSLSAVAEATHLGARQNDSTSAGLALAFRF